MICVTRLNGETFWVNPHQIERMEVSPDLTMHMLSGQCFVVKESAQEIVDAIINYRRSIGIMHAET